MNTTNINGQSIDQFVSKLASLLEYANPINAAETYEKALYAIYDGTAGDDELLGFVDLLHDKSGECASTTLNGEAEGPY